MRSQFRSVYPGSCGNVSGITILGIVVILLLVAVHGIHRVNPKDIDAKISQNLPLGSDSASVVRFLDSEHISHSALLPANHRVYAEIDRSTVGLIIGHIHIEFNFSADGKLVSYEVKELFDFL
jgi:hypothetical protein